MIPMEQVMGIEAASSTVTQKNSPQKKGTLL